MSPYSTYLLQDLICNSNPIKFVIDTPPGGVWETILVDINY